MARLDSFAIPGIYLWFYSHGHHPPHFHAKREEKWEVRVYFLNPAQQMFEKKWAYRIFSSSDRKEIVDAVTKHRLKLLEEWERKVQL